MQKEKRIGVCEMNRFMSFLKKGQSVINYLLFGVITTSANILIYYLCYYEWHCSNVCSNIVAWFIAKIIIAFITNKCFVFKSKDVSKKGLLSEFFSFIGCRLATGLLDLGIMFIAVDCLNQDGVFWKGISNILMIILNYLAGKLIVFHKQT